MHWWANAHFLVFNVTVYIAYLAQSFNVNKVHPRTVYERSEGVGRGTRGTDLLFL
jgi:hypothetical protein